MGLFGKRESALPRCPHCSQPQEEGHYCEEMKRKEKEIGDELERGASALIRRQETEAAKGTIYSDDVPLGEGKICNDRDLGAK